METYTVIKVELHQSIRQTHTLGIKNGVQSERSWLSNPGSPLFFYEGVGKGL